MPTECSGSVAEVCDTLILSLGGITLNELCNSNYGYGNIHCPSMLTFILFILLLLLYSALYYDGSY